MSYISSIKSMEEIGMEAGILKANRENTIKPPGTAVRNPIRLDRSAHQ